VTFYTVGHSTRTTEELTELLRAHGVTLVVDVRRSPRSKRHPHFDREALAHALGKTGIAYEHSDPLGGLRKARPDSPHTGWKNTHFRGFADHMETAEFRDELARWIDRGADEAIAFLCAEAVPWRCHRSLIADALTVRGHEVRHILSPQRADVHKLTPFAVPEGDGVRYPGLL
jgi:uncharacterized protein (DUF488 family)